MTLKNDFSWKFTFIAGVTSLTFFSIGWILLNTVKIGQLNLMGVILFVYFLIPVGFYVGVFGCVRKLFPKPSDSLIAQIFISLLIVLLIVAMWIVVDGSAYNFRDIGFISYWMREAERFVFVALYFAVAIPSLSIYLNRPKHRHVL